MNRSLLTVLTLAALTATAVTAAPTVTRQADGVDVDLGNGVKLRFAVADGCLLGLRSATVDGQPLKSDQTANRPFLCQEWADRPLFYEFMKLTDASVKDGKVVLTVELLANREAAAFRSFFVYGPDYDRALGAAITPELKALAEKKATADAAITKALEDHPASAKARQALAEAEAALKANTDNGQKGKLQSEVKKAKDALAKVPASLRAEVVAGSKALQAAQADVDAYQAELDRVALSIGKIHRDYFLFAHVQQSADVCALAALKKALADRLSASKPAGTLSWVFEPVKLNIAGWTWRGWKHHYTFTLADGQKVNALRELGTWEPGGQAAGNTLVNLRYRGLGGIAAKLTPMPDVKPSADAPNPVANTFTTTETLPGAVDKAPVVSPAVPGPQNVTTRAEGMKYRHAAWIAHLQRGGGVNWVDFCYRDAVGLAMWYDRMAAVRSLTEVWPGDTQVSYYDSLWFPLAGTQTTVPKHVLVMTPSAALPDHEWHTRWQEMDQFVRDHVARELGFVLYDPLPTIGINIDSGWEFRLKGILEAADGMKATGVKRVLVHHPGWFNGRGLRQKETAFPIPIGPDGQNDTGGDCSMHDYIPQSPRVADLWRAISRKMNENDIEYWGWVTGMVYGTGPVVQKFGPARFCRNAPNVDFSSGYPGSGGKAGHRGISVRDPEIAAWWKERMAAAGQDLGLSGFWADSFQNMFMSQMNYQHPDQAPQVREWWEWISAASREGMGWMSESTSFPGLSCSIEVGGNPEDFEGTWWTLPYVTCWYRGRDVPNKGTPAADRLFFRSAANKGPVCPGVGQSAGNAQQITAQIPGYKAISDQYMAALPLMRRPFQLSDERGVLWLANAGDAEGVLFSFADGPLPAGVTAAGLLDGKSADKFAAHQTYKVQAADLLKAFGVRRGDQKDPRLGAAYTPRAAFRRNWAASQPAADQK